MNWAMMGAMVSTHHNLVGLARVSAIVQDAPLQRDALTAAGCGRIFEEKVSTRSSARPGLAAALNYLRPDKGDVLAVWKLDRLGRSVKDVPTIADDLHGRGSGCASSPGNFPAPIARPGKGSSSSRWWPRSPSWNATSSTNAPWPAWPRPRAQGRTGGRPTVMEADKLAAAQARRTKDETPTQIAEALNVSRASVYRHLAHTNEAAAAHTE